MGFVIFFFLSIVVFGIILVWFDKDCKKPIEKSILKARDWEWWIAWFWWILYWVTVTFIGITFFD